MRNEIKFDDSFLNIYWRINLIEVVVSHKHQALPFFENSNSLF